VYALMGVQLHRADEAFLLAFRPAPPLGRTEKEELGARDTHVIWAGSPPNRLKGEP
jgi:hypothetical protein